MRRELRIVKDESVVGYVDDALKPPLDPTATDVLAAPLRQFGQRETVRRVLADGWSNGYLYFAEVTP